VPEPLVVFDCVVFLQGLIKESGPAVNCIECFEQGRIALAISPDVLIELNDVLSRSSLRQSFPLLTEDKAERLIELLLLKAISFARCQNGSNFQEILTTSHNSILPSKQGPSFSSLAIAIYLT
jgi:predicted nucleic acid-binding protein